MKRQIVMFVLGFTAVSGRLLQGQTADQLVTDGRAFLTQHNLTNAHLKFSAAVATSPNHENANALVSVTRLLNVLYQTPAQNFLTRLGVSAGGRDVYHWSATIPKDTNRVPIAPAGVSGAETTGFWRANAMPEITNSLANLARITNPNFLLNLSSNETTAGSVTLDYGDLLVLRAGLHFLEYFSYTVMAQNLDVQLTALRALYTNGSLNVQQLLLDHPQLLNFATTNDLALARTAFVNMVDRYGEGSDRMRARPPGVTRLFNIVANDGQAEEQFRQTLVELKASLTQAVTLSVDSNYTFFMGSQFSGASPWRSLLPHFRGHRVVLGAFDPSFGGLLIGHSTDEVEDYLFKERGLGRQLATVPSIPQVRHAGGSPFGFTLRAQSGRGYVVQASTNLLQWVDIGAFVAVDGAVDFVEQAAGQHQRRFYRIVDRDQSMPRPPNDSFANATILTGAPVRVIGFNRGATMEPGEPGSFASAGRSVWYQWQAPINATYVVDARGRGFYPEIRVFTGGSVAGLTQVGSSGSRAQFTATAGTIYRFVVDGSYFGRNQDGGFQLTITQPPAVSFVTPASSASITAGTSIPIQISAADPDGTIAFVDVFANGRLARLTNSPYTFLWTNSVPGDFYLNATAQDNSGVTASVGIPVTIHPINDDFANRTVLSGAAVTATGSNVGASTEAGEPNHAGVSSDNSVWWIWTAPSNGTYTIVADVKSLFGGHSLQPVLAVYTGSQLTSLASAASQLSPVAGPAVVTINGVSGQAYQIVVACQYGNTGNITLRIVPSAPPQVAIVTPADGATLYANQGDTNMIVSVSATAPAGRTVSRVDLYRYSSLSASLTNPPYNFTVSLYSPSTHDFVAVATDNHGAVAMSSPVHLSLVRPPPPNDMFGNALNISGGSYTGPTINNFVATKESGEPNHYGRTGGKSLWWSWVAPKTGVVTIDSIGSSYDTVMAVYTGNAVNVLTLVASDDDSGGSGTSRVSFTATSGITYRIAVDSYGSGASGNVRLNLSQL